MYEIRDKAFQEWHDNDPTLNEMYGLGERLGFLDLAFNAGWAARKDLVFGSDHIG